MVVVGAPIGQVLSMLKLAPLLSHVAMFDEANKRSSPAGFSEIIVLHFLVPYKHGIRSL
jgi:hypothetical protein